MKTLKTTLPFIVLIILNACSPKTTVNTYWVNSMKGECTGTAPMQCLLVQEGESIEPSAWKSFYAPIEGFSYQAGYIYQIKVTEEQLSPEEVPADASSIKYSLVKIVSQEVDPKFRLNDIWAPTTLFGKKISASGSNAGQQMMLEIHMKDMRIMGTDGCNNFNGSILEIGQDILKLGPIASTRMMCADMTWTDKFNKAIQKVEKYEIKNMTLYLYCEEGNELMTLKKGD